MTCQGAKYLGRSNFIAAESHPAIPRIEDCTEYFARKHAQTWLEGNGDFGVEIWGREPGPKAIILGNL